MKKFLIFLLCLLLAICLSACGVDEQTEIKKVHEQCEHIVTLAFDGTNTATTKCQYDIEENSWTAYIINTNISASDMEDFQWQGNGLAILNLENSLNNLCLSIKNVFNKSELKRENYSVFIHFTDKNEKVYFTSKNGITHYSAWGRK